MTEIKEPSNRAEAEARIKELVKEAEATISRAEAIADKWYVDFGLDIAYGMGGTYQPQHVEGVSVWSKPEGDDDFVTVDGVEFEYYRSYDEEDGGWVSSSSQC